MPAMSPTMTEGNIASWNVKEGDSFSAGDVLLEIETDKAQMEVEAQDDGVMAKIMIGDGSKSVKVGSRIAVIADSNDDLSNLTIPADEQPPKSASSQEKGEGKPAPSPAQSEEPSASDEKPPSGVSQKPSAPQEKQTYPLYPSVQRLIHTNNLSASDADRIPASGPNGRLLKGDVLSYLGTIGSSSASDLSQSVASRGHMDLSNIKISAPPQKPSDPTSKPPSPSPQQPLAERSVEEPAPTEVAVPVSLAAALAVQRRIGKTLGVHLPLSTFISRATTVANASLPRAKTTDLTADELFNAVLGLSPATVSAGSYTPQITALPSASPYSDAPPSPTSSSPSSSTTTSARSRKVTDADVYDILTGSSRSTVRSRRGNVTPDIATSEQIVDEDLELTTNVFSVSAMPGEEERVRVFLERVKTVLEDDPGRLVL
ncbi:MAG: hypothetical protein M1825_004181 [Sarcosagium campestre]|nr:MAG: hypothetical protein M1825_004181 [Sarcosagium campestre]